MGLSAVGAQALALDDLLTVGALGHHLADYPRLLWLDHTQVDLVPDPEIGETQGRHWKHIGLCAEFIVCSPGLVEFIDAEAYVFSSAEPYVLAVSSVVTDL